MKQLNVKRLRTALHTAMDSLAEASFIASDYRDDMETVAQNRDQKPAFYQLMDRDQKPAFYQLMDALDRFTDEIEEIENRVDDSGAQLADVLKAVRRLGPVKSIRLPKGRR